MNRVQRQRLMAEGKSLLGIPTNPTIPRCRHGKRLQFNNMTQSWSEIAPRCKECVN